MAMAVGVGTARMASTVAAVCRAAVGLGEHPSFVVPELPSGLTLGFLVLAVDPQEHDERFGQADHAAARAGFRRAGVGANLLAVGAVSGLPAALSTASVLVLGA
jgi:hypothetical protein